MASVQAASVLVFFERFGLLVSESLRKFVVLQEVQRVEEVLGGSILLSLEVSRLRAWLEEGRWVRGLERLVADLCLLLLSGYEEEEEEEEEQEEERDGDGDVAMVGLKELHMMRVWPQRLSAALEETAQAELEALAEQVRDEERRGTMGPQEITLCVKFLCDLALRNVPSVRAAIDADVASAQQQRLCRPERLPEELGPRGRSCYLAAEREQPPSGERTKHWFHFMRDVEPAEPRANVYFETFEWDGEEEAPRDYALHMFGGTRAELTGDQQEPRAKRKAAGVDEDEEEWLRGHVEADLLPAVDAAIKLRAKKKRRMKKLGIDRSNILDMSVGVEVGRPRRRRKRVNYCEMEGEGEGEGEDGEEEDADWRG